MEKIAVLADEHLYTIVEHVIPELEGVDNVIDAARFVPVQYFGARAENVEDETFIVRKSHVLAIKRYVRAGLSLPVDISAVESYLGYRESGHARLQPASMQQFYQRVHQHALSWSTLERETKNVGIQLDRFASTFVDSGANIIELLKDSETYKSVQGNVEALDDDEKTRLAAIPLSSTDTKRIENLKKALQWAKNDVASFYLNVASVNRLAVEFSRKISDGLLVEVTLKLKAVEEAHIENGEDIEALRGQVRALDEAIAEKQSEYNLQVGYAFTGLVFGPLGLLVTGGMFGAQAEATRAQKNELLLKKERVVEKLSSARLSQSLINLATNCTEMRALMRDAEQGIKCLEDVLGIVWNSLGASLDAFEEHASEWDLILLVLNLQAIFTPWKTIQGHARALSAVFNQIVADE